MITITELAKSKIIELAEAEGIEHYDVRLKICGGGCSGYTYDIFFEEIINDTDEIMEIDNIKIIIDHISFNYLDGTEIDYLENAFSSGFRFNNPQVKSTCGCQKSVGF